MDLETYIKELNLKDINVKHVYTKTGSYYILGEDDAKVFFTDNSYNGEIFKDILAYKSSEKEVCYISESNYKEYEKDILMLIDEYEANKITTLEFFEGLNELSEIHGYTRENFMSLANNQKEVADMLIEDISWETPEAYYDNQLMFYELDEFQGVFVLTDGLELNECLYELYKNNWKSERGIKEKVDPEIGINGECFVCYEEFLNNELKDKEFILDLITEDNRKKAFPILADCHDFATLIKELDKGTLLDIENTLYLYENSLIDMEENGEYYSDYNFFEPAIHWYEGLENTSQFVDECSALKSSEMIIQEPEMEVER